MARLYQSRIGSSRARKEPRPPYSDGGFNGDADLLGDNSDPRDYIPWSSGLAVWASQSDPLAYRVSTGGELEMWC